MLSFGVILGTLVVVLATIVIRHFRYWRVKGVPTVDTFPLVGVFFPILTRQKSMADAMNDVYNAIPDAKYFGIMDFRTPVLFVKDPELIKDIGVKNFTSFPNHNVFFDESFDPIFSKNVFALKDDRWREVRSLLTPAFTASRMKYMFQLISKCAEDFSAHLLEHPEMTDEMDMKDVYTRYTSDVIATAAFGVGVNSVKDRTNEFYMNGLDATDFESFTQLIKLTAARVIPKIVNLLGIKLLNPKTDKFFRSLIENTLKERDEKGIARPDMINLMMEARNNENIKMTTEDITAQALIFFFAGFATSAQLMCFVSHVLSHEPEIQERLRKEVDATLKETNGDISYEALSRMKYMDMVLAETLRMYPSSPFTDRVCSQSYELPGATKNSQPFTVPENMILWFPVYSLHHDPKYFPNPGTFDPERFSDENKDNINPYAYIPFGIGPRKCIGNRFVLMETKILMTYLLRHFVFKPSPKTTKKINFARTGVVLVPNCGFWMKMEKRSKGIKI